MTDDGLKLVFEGNVDIRGKIEHVKLHATRCDACGDAVFLVSVADPITSGVRTTAGIVTWSRRGDGPVETRCRDCAGPRLLTVPSPEEDTP